MIKSLEQKDILQENNASNYLIAIVHMSSKIYEGIVLNKVKCSSHLNHFQKCRICLLLEHCSVHVAPI